MTIETTILGPGFAADIGGVDLARADAAEIEAIHAALGRHGVLRVRDQSLDEDAFLSFAATFGPLDDAPDPTLRPDHPKLAVISNIVENGRAMGSLGAGEAQWHSDMTYLQAPPRISILLGVEVPPEGGDTGFCDMEQALHTLPETLRRRIDGLDCVHDATRNSTGELRRKYVGQSFGVVRPGARHPLVVAHPATGRPVLFLGRRLGAAIPGLAAEESEAILDALWDHVVLDAPRWRQSWRPGDVLIWDNQRVLHRRDPFDPAARRLMHRAQIGSAGRTLSAATLRQTA